MVYGSAKLLPTFYRRILNNLLTKISDECRPSEIVVTGEGNIGNILHHETIWREEHYGVLGK